MYLLKKVFEFREKAHSDHEKPFLEHLEDLRVMVTRVVITLVVSMIICFTFQQQLMDVLRRPAENVLLMKQKESLPDAQNKAIKALSVELWAEAKKIEQVAAGLNDDERAKFYQALGRPELEFHAHSVTLLRSVKALPEEKRKSFIKSLGVDNAMREQLMALLISGPDVDVNSDSNLKMMSALKPTETFMLSMKLAFFAGIVLAFPLLLLFILQFVLPGLHHNERKVLWPAMLVGFGLFSGGVLFAYYLVLPKALLFFYEWSSGLGVSNDWRIGEYITFATQFTLLFGLSFELPVVVMVLVKLGLLSYETMSRTRAYAIVAIFIAAAVITPTPDAMTLILMATPMTILYEICIWLAWFDRKKARDLEAAEEEELKQRRLGWMLSNDANQHDGREKGNADSHPPHLDLESDHADGDDGWHQGFDPETSHGMPEDEEWTHPEDPGTEPGEDKPGPIKDEKHERE
ncbi:MAG: twin-arginine translocase subunit TatC [Armatimonadetes bacterium]|nr:twin-arginine translocase subunit TatC [Akkermansiaceae bacterium]